MLDGEGSVATGTLCAHFHRLVVALSGADVPAGIAGRHEGAEGQPSVTSVEQKSHQLAVRTEMRQAVFVLHRLRCEKIKV